MSVEFKRMYSNDLDIFIFLVYMMIYKFFDYLWRFVEYFLFFLENYKIYIFFSYVRLDCVLFIGIKNILVF